MNIYYIQLRGQVDEAEINTMSPLQMVRERGDTNVTLFSIHTDQSGLVGLIRHLHGLGYVFLAVSCEQENGGFGLSEQITLDSEARK